ncbi:MAG TPA: ferritin-like domain-containing protein, partial [Polyangiaceae bacterium]
GPGAICECGFPISPSGGVCRNAGCRVDSDCGPGLLCATYATFCGYGGFACQSVRDQCASDLDCGGMGSCYMDSVSPSSIGRHCASVDCGRPFLIESVMRVAATVRDDAWGASLDDEPDVDALSVFERATQAARWTRMGQLEHASIAAFARFSLQLLSLGAPSELVEACTSALADETAHAKLCFRLASAYAGHAVGPGPLDVTNSLASTSLGDIVDLVIAEGCFGETIATLDAQEAAEEATDPVIAAAFGRIASDEQRHAELAFGFLRWALEREPALVRRRIAEAMESTFDHTSGAREVVVPCLLALLRQARAA